MPKRFVTRLEMVYSVMWYKQLPSALFLVLKLS